MKKTIIEPHKSSLGLDANIAVLVTYVAMVVISWIPWLGYLAWAVPVVFFVLEKNSKFVKFQAVQALIIGIIRAAISLVFSIIGWALVPKNVNSLLTANWNTRAALVTVFSIIGIIIGLAITALVVYVVLMAYKYTQLELPVIGPIAEKASAKLDSVIASQQANQQQAAPAADPNAVIYCAACGQANPADTRFCVSCGNPF